MLQWFNNLNELTSPESQPSRNSPATSVFRKERSGSSNDSGNKCWGLRRKGSPLNTPPCAGTRRLLSVSQQARGPTVHAVKDLLRARTLKSFALITVWSRAISAGLHNGTSWESFWILQLPGLELTFSCAHLMGNAKYIQADYSLKQPCPRCPEPPPVSSGNPTAQLVSRKPTVSSCLPLQTTATLTWCIYHLRPPPWKASIYTLPLPSGVWEMRIYFSTAHAVCNNLLSRARGLHRAHLVCNCCLSLSHKPSVKQRQSQATKPHEVFRLTFCLLISANPHRWDQFLLTQAWQPIATE